MTNEELQNHPTVIGCKEIMDSKDKDGMKSLIVYATKHSLEAKEEMGKFFNSNIIQHLNNAYKHLQILAEVNKYMDSFNNILTGEYDEGSSYEWRFGR